MSNNFKESFSGGLPREEFEKSGGNAAALTSEKLLAILLKTGAPGCNVMELSHRLVSAFGGTGHLVRANFIQLKELTRRLMEVSKVMAIPLYDHIVLGAVGSAGGKGYVSFRERRLVDFER